VDTLVLSSCVQMPSLAAIPVVEQEVGLPVVSAAVCTTYQMLQKLGLRTHVPAAGALLSGKYS
jgi:maleate isomerase